MSNIIPFNYQGEPVRFNSDGWINATDAVKRFGKRVDHWLANSETQHYIAVLSEALNTRDSGDLIVSRRGRGGGTWLHPKLVVSYLALYLRCVLLVLKINLECFLKKPLIDKVSFLRFATPSQLSDFP